MKNSLRLIASIGIIFLLFNLSNAEDKLQWLRKAAGKGALGSMYSKGPVMSQDYTETENLVKERKTTSKNETRPQDKYKTKTSNIEVIRVVAYFDIFNEVFLGTMTETFEGAGRIEVRGKRSGTKCSGNPHLIENYPNCIGNRSKATLTCNDGRIINANFESTSCRNGTGEAYDQQGNRLSFFYGDNEIILGRILTKVFRASFKKHDLPPVDSQSVGRTRPKGVDSKNESAQQPISTDYRAPSKPLFQIPTHSRKFSQKTVKYVQTRLSKLGYDPGSIDGILGIRTRRAIQLFQNDIGTPATGKIDEMLLSQIESVIQRRKSLITTKPKIATINKQIHKNIPIPSSVLPEMPNHLSFHLLKPEDIFQKLKKSIFVIVAANSIEALKKKIRVSQGSAVAVSPSHLLTNCHVIKNKGIILAIQGKQQVTANLVGKNEDCDICVLQVKKIELIPVDGVRKFENLVVGEKVYTIGSPIGLERTLGEGIISGLREHKGLKLIQTSAPISRGSSGGGLFDSRGNLIGITTFLIKDAQNLNFAISAEQYWK